MKCPVCKKETLSIYQVIEGLPGNRCTHCEGTFISSIKYWEWLKTQSPLEPEIALDDTDASSVEVMTPKICPDCGHLLTRFKVWPNVNFFLDSCGHCNGIWLDKNEWQTLQEHHLHNRMNLFLTRPWQAKIHAAEAQKRFDAMYLARFGAEDYTRVKEIREWVNNHPMKNALIAFLTDVDPYKA